MRIVTRARATDKRQAYQALYDYLDDFEWLTLRLRLENV